MNDIDEQLLLQRLATPATRHEAFELLVKTYAQPLYWKIRRMVLVHEDADDLVQNVFLKAWSALDNFKQQAKSRAHRRRAFVDTGCLGADVPDMQRKDGVFDAA